MSIYLLLYGIAALLTFIALMISAVKNDGEITLFTIFLGLWICLAWIAIAPMLFFTIKPVHDWLESKKLWVSKGGV